MWSNISDKYKDLLNCPKKLNNMYTNMEIRELHQ